MKPLLLPGFLALCAAAVVSPAPGAQQLYWNGAGEWNTSALNWATTPYGTDYTNFNAGDSVSLRFGSVFIGSGGVPGAVSPSTVFLYGNTVVHGGDISGPASVVIVDEESHVVFSNYAGGLSFTGGARLTDEASMTLDVGTAPEDATVW